MNAGSLPAAPQAMKALLTGFQVDGNPWVVRAVLAPPSLLWKPYPAMLPIEPKRRTEEDRANPRDILASYIGAKFHQVHWEAATSSWARGRQMLVIAAPGGSVRFPLISNIRLPAGGSGQPPGPAVSQPWLEVIRRSAAVMETTPTAVVLPRF